VAAVIAPQPSNFDQVAFGTSAFVELLKNSFEIAAIILGAIWTYFNFFKGRTYRPRLECNVDGSVHTDSGRPLLKALTKVKNVGLSKVRIDQEGTILQLFSSVRQNSIPSFPCQVTWNDRPAVFDVFKEHKWVEPLETIEDQVLIELPDDRTSDYKLNLKVLSKRIWWKVLSNGISWTARSIVSVGGRMKGGTDGQSSGSDASRPKRDS
jgi:hypothetical protein